MVSDGRFFRSACLDDFTEERRENGPLAAEGGGSPVKRLRIIVNHSREHLEMNLEEFINHPQRIIETIDFCPVPSAAGGVIHVVYIMYKERKSELP
jgi:hypothetical protein